MRGPARGRSAPTHLAGTYTCPRLRGPTRAPFCCALFPSAPVTPDPGTCLSPPTPNIPPPTPQRSRLPQEGFAAFLGAIKALNSGELTRRDALARAKQLFGARDADLYAAFEALLSRHMPA
jgi:hypothetical protein